MLIKNVDVNGINEKLLEDKCRKKKLITGCKSLEYLAKLRISCTI